MMSALVVRALIRSPLSLFLALFRDHDLCSRPRGLRCWLLGGCVGDSQYHQRRTCSLEFRRCGGLPTAFCPKGHIHKHLRHGVRGSRAVREAPRGDFRDVLQGQCAAGNDTKHPIRHTRRCYRGRRRGRHRIWKNALCYLDTARWRLTDPAPAGLCEIRRQMVDRGFSGDSASHFAW